MTWRVCLQDGCPELTESANRRCPAHQPPRSPSSKATSSPGWRRIRRLVLERDGYRCQIGLPGCTGEATVVDHIQAAADQGSNRPSNLRASCESCNIARRPKQVRALSASAQSKREHESIVDARLREQDRRGQAKQDPPTGGRSGLLFD